MSDKPEALRLADALDTRVVPRWIHSTGETPRQSGYAADVQCAQAAAELRRLRAECEALRADAADFHMAYRMKCDEETKVQAVELERLRAERDALRARNKELVAMICEVHTTLMPHYSKSHEGRAWLEKMAKLT